MSHFNETMTKKEMATEFRRSMAALEECADGTNDQAVSSQLDLRKVTNRLDKSINLIFVLSILNSFCIWIVIIALLLRG